MRLAGAALLFVSIGACTAFTASNGDEPKPPISNSNDAGGSKPDGGLITLQDGAVVAIGDAGSNPAYSNELSRDLIARYTFDDGTGRGTVGDACELRGAATFVLEGHESPGLKPAQGGFCEAPKLGLPAPPNQLTIAVWVFIPTTPGGKNEVLVTLGPEVELKLEDADRAIQLSVEGLAKADWQTSAGIGAGWHHVAATYNNNATEIYADGAVSQSKIDGEAGLFANITGPVKVGCSDSTDKCFGGVIDDVAIWSRALSATEIREIYELR